MPTRLLLVVNRNAGVGHAVELVQQLERKLQAAFPGAVTTAVVEDHPAATRAVSEFLEETSLPTTVIVGGGGATDDWEDGDPGSPEPRSKDVEYLLSSLREYMPDAGLGPEKVTFVYSGFRPLLGSCQGDPSRANREESMEVSPSGLISVMGGKLTTARVMAIRVLDLVMHRIGRDAAWTSCRTDRLSIGGSNEEVAEALSTWVKRGPPLKDYFRTLFQRYGVDADAICAEALRIHQGRHLDPRAEPIRAEVEYVCRHEMTCTVEDLMDRRAGYLYWSPGKRVERLRYGAHVIRAELGLTEEDFEWQLARYQEHLLRFHSLPPAEDC